MRREVTDEVEKRRKACVRKHAPDIAAYGKDPAPFDDVMPVQNEGVCLLGDAAAIDDGLTVVLASRFQMIEF